MKSQHTKLLEGGDTDDDSGMTTCDNRTSGSPHRPDRKEVMR